MPQLQSIEPVEIKLPSSTEADPAIVKVVPITAGDMTKVKNTDQSEVVWELLAVAIREWNFLDKEGKPEAITPDSVRRLSALDFTEIITKIGLNANLDEIKKKSDIAPSQS
jgi:hypothetical protein